MPNISVLIQQAIDSQSSLAVKVEKQIGTLPEGSLYKSVKSNKSYYFHCISTKGIKIRKYIGTTTGKNTQLIFDLKRKRFLLACIKVLEGNVAALRACLKKYIEFDPAQISSRMAASYENIRDETDNREGLDWQHTPYERGNMFPEALKHEAI
jgi:hypothetical protein